MAQSRKGLKQNYSDLPAPTFSYRLQSNKQQLLFNAMSEEPKRFNLDR